MFYIEIDGVKFKINPYQTELVKLVSIGLKENEIPELIMDGQGGTYLMRSKGKTVAVFKPTDEEPKTDMNPKGKLRSASGEGLKKGTRAGEGAFNEVAAYVLDHPMKGPRGLDRVAEIGFSGVPLTILVKGLNKNFNHPPGKPIADKMGSLQKFIENDGDCNDEKIRSYLRNLFPKEMHRINGLIDGFYQDIPVKEVQKISVLDIRMANADRHGGNILRKMEDGKMKLTPIDHGYCLPEIFEDCTFAWLEWKQAKKTYTQETVTYIKSLDADYDIELLKKLGWTIPNKSARTLKISTKLLRKGVDRGLTPYEIGKIMCREDYDKESVIEIIMREAEDAMSSDPDMNETEFLNSVYILMDSHLDKIMKEAEDARSSDPDMNETLS